MMTRKPIFNALGAAGYIVLVASVLYIVGETQGNKPDTFFAPVAFISLLTLSVAVMAYMFFYQPLLLYMDGKRKEAAAFFVQTVGLFGVITVCIWGLLISGVI